MNTCLFSAHNYIPLLNLPCFDEFRKTRCMQILSSCYGPPLPSNTPPAVLTPFIILITSYLLLNEVDTCHLMQPTLLLYLRIIIIELCGTHTINVQFEMVMLNGIAN